MFVTGFSDWCQFMNHFIAGEPAFKEDSYPDLRGKVYIVTGGCTGIGYHVTRYLIMKNATVYMAARNQSKIDAAIESLTTEFPSAKLDYIIVDLGDLASIKPGVQKFLDKAVRLDGVVHNAGVMTPEPGSKTKQGYELQLGTNAIGPWLLQKFLDDVLIETAKKSPPNSVRVLWVSSSAHMMSKKGGMNWDNPNEGNKWGLYGQSKAINIMQSILWAQHHEGSGVVSLNCHPGNIRSELQRYASKIEGTLIKGLLYDTKYGAYTELYAMLNPVITTEDNGLYVIPFGKRGKARNDIVQAAQGEDGQKLYNWLTEQVKDYL
ncbi:hypothetical protein TRVA0_036S01002 [Trichomonascus vanleenenianus]|uniref:uncharacterized protein n=1 Tax=Trichomonascus vanleenenianus TaxID=2268995 RepID=UPI003ECAB78F